MTGPGGSESKLVLTAKTTGLTNAITVTVDDDDGNDIDTNGLSALVYDPGGSGATNLTVLQAADDAQIKLNTQTVTSATNTFTSAIEGVTIDLVAVGTSEALTVALDTASVKAAIQSFISGYNGVISTIASLGSYDADTGSAGILIGDATLLGISSAIRSAVNTRVAGVAGPFSTLAAIGVTSDALTGQLGIDNDILDAALASNFDDLGLLFTASDGVAVRLDGAITAVRAVERHDRL